MDTQDGLTVAEKGRDRVKDGEGINQRTFMYNPRAWISMEIGLGYRGWGWVEVGKGRESRNNNTNKTKKRKQKKRGDFDDIPEVKC